MHQMPFFVTHTSESFTSCRIPALAFDLLTRLSYRDDVTAELHADSRVGIGQESLFGQLDKQTRLAHARVTDKDKFGQEIPIGHGG
jgi:hypothetical protein